MCDAHTHMHAHTLKEGTGRQRKEGGKEEGRNGGSGCESGSRRHQSPESAGQEECKAGMEHSYIDRQISRYIRRERDRQLQIAAKEERVRGGCCKSRRCLLPLRDTSSLQPPGQEGLDWCTDSEARGKIVHLSGGKHRLRYKDDDRAKLLRVY